MIRKTFLAALLATGAAHAETPTQSPAVNLADNLAFCGSQVATLAWFYQGVVNDGNPSVQADLDGLLQMQSIFIRQVEAQGEESIDLFKRMTKKSVDELAVEMQGTQESGALALAHVNTNVRGCADLYFEKIEE